MFCDSLKRIVLTRFIFSIVRIVVDSAGDSDAVCLFCWVEIYVCTW